MHFTLEQCQSENLDVYIQEVCWLGSDFITHLGYNFYCTSLREKRQHGVGMVIHNSLDVVIGDIFHQSERLMAANIVVYDCEIQVISAYAANEKNHCFQKR